MSERWRSSRFAGALPAAQSPQSNGSGGDGAVPTPRLANGRPDLSGTWGGRGGGGGARELVEYEPGKLAEEFPSRRCGPNQVNCGDYTNQSEDGEFTARLNSEPADLQTGVLGQGAAAGHVDQ